MGFEYKIFPEKRLIEVVWNGSFGLESINSNLDGLYSDPLYQADYRGLCDAREADFQLAENEIEKNQAFVANHKNSPTGPWAVICAAPLQTAYAMMYEGIGKPSHPIQVFSSIEAGMEWLDKMA